MPRKPRTTTETTLTTIAQSTLGIETLETRRSDQLDFHEVAVWSLREALEAAYEAGRQAASQAEATTPPWANVIKASPSATRLWKVAKISRGGRLYALIVKANTRQAAIDVVAGRGKTIDCFEINETGAVIG
jgi:hypothetical protein